MTLPLTSASLEKVIRKRRYEMTLPISDKDWVLLNPHSARQIDVRNVG